MTGDELFAFRRKSGIQGSRRQRVPGSSRRRRRRRALRKVWPSRRRACASGRARIPCVPPPAGGRRSERRGSVAAGGLPCGDICRARAGGRLRSSCGPEPAGICRIGRIARRLRGRDDGVLWPGSPGGGPDAGRLRSGGRGVAVQRCRNRRRPNRPRRGTCVPSGAHRKRGGRRNRHRRNGGRPRWGVFRIPGTVRPGGIAPAAGAGRACRPQGASHDRRRNGGGCPCGEACRSRGRARGPGGPGRALRRTCGDSCAGARRGPPGRHGRRGAVRGVRARRARPGRRRAWKGCCRAWRRLRSVR